MAKKPMGVVILMAAFGCTGPSDLTHSSATGPSGAGLPQVDLPMPASWSPPQTTLTKAFSDEAGFLLTHGMSDPRGGTFGSAKVIVGSLWMGGEAPEEIHGWVLPDKKHIVATTGLIYETVSVGAPIDLDAEGAAELARWSPQSGPHRYFPNPRFKGWNSTTASLLLVAGKPKLAEQLVAAFGSSATARQNPSSLNEFLTHAFDQAVTAHMRGDDLTALRVGRFLLKNQAAYETQAGGPREGRDGQGKPIQQWNFGFLGPIPALVADTERRVREKPKPPLDPKTLAAQTVEVLIDRLDEVNARQWGQPGGVDLGSDPIVAALIGKGAPAVDALLNAVEKDDRLTRSVSFGRDFFPMRNLITVRAAAYAAFRGIAEFDELPAAAADGKFDVASLRRFWAENGSKSPSDRWFDTLADDKAGWRRWDEATTRLFDKVGTRRSGIVSVAAAGGPINAEAVRARSNPSLSDLLERRAKDIARPSSDPLTGDHLVYVALRLATQLGKWDPPRSLPVLRDLTQRAMDLTINQRFEFAYIGSHVVPALEARAAAGDREAWTDYVGFLRKLPLIHDEWYAEAFKPVIAHAEVPGMKQAAIELFTKSDSDWNFGRRLRRGGGAAVGDPLTVSPLLRIPEIRNVVLAALADPATIGTVWVEGNGTIQAKTGDQQGGRGGDPDVAKDPLRPKANEQRPYRVKDFTAMLFDRIKDGPKFKIYWPAPQKDQAVRQIAEIIRKNGDHIEEVLPWPYNWREPDFGRRRSP